MEILITRGQMIVFPERAEQWEEYVEKSYNDKYRGQDAAEALEIIEALNRGVGLDEAKKMLTEIEPNGEANGPIRRAVLLFANRGPEFWKETSEGHISLRTRFQLFRISRQNAKLTKLYQYTLAPGKEPNREEESESKSQSKEDQNQSWVLGDDEMQIVMDHQSEIAEKAKQDRDTGIAQENKNQKKEIDNDPNEGLEI